MRRLIALLTATTFTAALTPALAADKAACVSAYEATQKLKKSGKLLEARQKALICAQDGCPAVVRDDCTSWSVELDKVIPSIVLVVTDGEGRDVTDATAYVDGEKVTAHVEGKAIALDPGAHKLRVERAGFDPIEQDVVAHEGDHNRKVTIKFVSKDTGKDAPVAPAPPASSPTTDVSRPIPTSAWVFTGLGVAGLAGFAAFGLMGNQKKSDLDARACKPACPRDDVDAAKRDYLVADVALGVSVVSFGVAAILILTRGEQRPATSNVEVGVAPRSVSLTVRF